MHEATTSDRKRIVVLFTLNGAALGVLLAMLFLTTGTSSYDGYGRTHIDESIPLTIGMAMTGGMVGAVLSHTRSENVGRMITIGVLLLTGLLGGAVGWLVGDAQTISRVIQEIPPLPPLRAVAVGSLMGSVVGLLTLVPRWLKSPGTKE